MDKDTGLFEEIEARAWNGHGTSEFVGFGTIEITPARSRSGRASYLQFRLKSRLIKREEAKRFIEKYAADDEVLRKRFRAPS